MLPRPTRPAKRGMERDGEIERWRGLGEEIKEEMEKRPRGDGEEMKGGEEKGDGKRVVGREEREGGQGREKDEEGEDEGEDKVVDLRAQGELAQSPVKCYSADLDLRNTTSYLASAKCSLGCFLPALQPCGAIG